MTRWIPGLVSVSFRKKTPEEILTAMVKAELFAVEWGSDVHAPPSDDAALKRIAALQKEAGVRCCSYGTYFRLGVTPTAELPAYIRAAAVLGTDVLRLWCGDRDPGEYAPREREALFDACRKAAEIAEKSGVTLCLECHNKTYTATRAGAEEVMEAVSSPAFGMYWQPNQYRSETENLAYAAALAPRIRHVHVFQWAGKERFPLKAGIDVWKRYLTALGGRHHLLLEFMPDDEIGSLRREADALRRIMEEAE